MKLLIKISLLLAFLSNEAHANWNISSNSFTGSTSDEIDYLSSTLELNHAPTDLFWPYQNKSQNEWGVKLRTDRSTSSILDFSYEEFRIYKSWTLKDAKVTLELGNGKIRSDHTVNRLVGALTYEAEFKKKLQVTAIAEQGFSSPTILPLNSFPLFAFTQSLKMKTKYMLTKKWDLQLQHRIDSFSNSNTRQEFDSELMYVISRFPTWARVGVGASYLKFAKQDPRHWSPQKLFSYGPRLDLGIPIYKKLNFFTGGSYTFFQEESFKPGSGHYLRLGLSHGNREGLQLRFFVEDSESTQNNNTWSSRFYHFSARYTW